MEFLDPPKAGAVSLDVGIAPELPAWHSCLGKGTQRPAGKTPDWASTWQEECVMKSGFPYPSLPVNWRCPNIKAFESLCLFH